MKTYLEPIQYMSYEQFVRDIDKPGLLMRLKALEPDARDRFMREFRHVQRVREGSRARPDLLPNGGGYRQGQTSSPGNNVRSREAPLGYPTPYMPADTYRPDIAADPEMVRTLEGQADRLQTEMVTAALGERMGTDADRPAAPVTLRDQLEAAYAVHTKE